jgi:hypothetical protein
MRSRTRDAARYHGMSQRLARTAGLCRALSEHLGAQAGNEDDEKTAALKRLVEQLKQAAEEQLSIANELAGDAAALVEPTVEQLAKRKRRQIRIERGRNIGTTGGGHGGD